MLRFVAVSSLVCLVVGVSAQSDNATDTLCGSGMSVSRQALPPPPRPPVRGARPLPPQRPVLDYITADVAQELESPRFAAWFKLDVGPEECQEELFRFDFYPPPPQEGQEQDENTEPNPGVRFVVRFGHLGLALTMDEGITRTLQQTFIPMVEAPAADEWHLMEVSWDGPSCGLVTIKINGKLVGQRYMPLQSRLSFPEGILALAMDNPTCSYNIQLTGINVYSKAADEAAAGQCDKEGGDVVSYATSDFTISSPRVQVQPADVAACGCDATAPNDSA